MKPVKPKWRSGQDLVREWGIKGFELFDLMKKGLQAYTSTGKKVVDSDSLPREKRQSLEQVEANQRAKQNAMVIDGSGSSLGRTRSEDEIKTQARRIYDNQSLEILNPPKDCELMSFTLPSNDERAKEAISKVLCFQFKSVDIVEFENEYNQSHPLPSEKTPNETAYPKKQPEQDFQEEANEIKDPENFIRSLQVSYVSDTEIKIRGGGKNAKIYEMKELGFKKVNSKTWNEFIKILTRQEPLYYAGKARGANGEINKLYQSARKILVEINKKLVPFLNKTYQVQLPKGFTVYELIPGKKEAPGTYRFKFQIKSNSDDTEHFKALPKNQLLRLIEELSEKYGKLSNRGDEEAESQTNKIKDKLNAAVEIACRKEWLPQNRARSYLNPTDDDPPPVEPSIRDEDSIHED